ncbi:MAG: 30S ribosomal protein S20 [Clostridia bacterium]|nr:30S ribosomal protein S20 [Clostridia bacterium]
MPNIKSAMKRVKVSKKKNLRNRMIKSGVKTAVKKYEAALTQEQLSMASSALDKAATKGVIHKNAANRKKARLARKLAAAK